MNKKGFVLMETLVVIIFVLVVFTLLYNNAIPLVGKLEEMSYYDDLDTTYDVYQIRNILKKDANFESLIADDIKFLKCSDLDNTATCDALFNSLDINDNK